MQVGLLFVVWYTRPTLRCGMPLRRAGADAHACDIEKLEERIAVCIGFGYASVRIRVGGWFAADSIGCGLGRIMVWFGLGLGLARVRQVSWFGAEVGSGYVRGVALMFSWCCPVVFLVFSWCFRAPRTHQENTRKPSGKHQEHDMHTP